MEDSVPRIVREVLAGNLDQYRLIVRLYEADVYRLAALLTGDRILAEDITQEVFVKAYRLLDRYDRDQPMRPWLMGIAKNVMRNETRKLIREKQRRALYVRYLEMECTEAASAHVEAVSEALAQCRRALSGAAAEAIRLRYDEGMSVEQVADQLKRTRPGTLQLLYRARQLLKDCLQTRLSAEG